MKRLFSVLFVVCAVCIFPKLSFAPEEGTYPCESFCMNCKQCDYDVCMDHLLDLASCNNVFDSCFMIGIDDSSASDYPYSNIDSDDFTSVCNETSGGGNGSSSNKCTVSYYAKQGCSVWSTQTIYTSGTTLTPPSRSDLKENDTCADAKPPAGQKLAGWCLDPEGENCNVIYKSGDTYDCSRGNINLYPKYEFCTAGMYLDLTTSDCAECPQGSYCTGGKQEVCPAGTYGSTTKLTTSACSGQCEAGYYCPAGSTSARQLSCPDYSSSGGGGEINQ